MSKLEALADRMDAHAKEANDIAKAIYALIERQTVPRNITVESVRGNLTEEQLGFLKVTDEKDHVRVSFNQFMPPTMFGDMKDRLKGVRGEYFEKTASTAPHFKIPK